MSDSNDPMADLDPVGRAKVAVAIVHNVQNAARTATLQILNRGLGIGFATLALPGGEEGEIAAIVIVSLDPARARQLLELIKAIPADEGDGPARGEG